MEGRLCWVGLEYNWLKTVKPSDMNQVLPEEITAWYWWAWPQGYRSGFPVSLRWLSVTTYPSWPSVSSLVKWRWWMSLGSCADPRGDICKAFGTVCCTFDKWVCMKLKKGGHQSTKIYHGSSSTSREQRHWLWKKWAFRFLGSWTPVALVWLLRISCGCQFSFKAPYLLIEWHCGKWLSFQAFWCLKEGALNIGF